MGKISKLIRNGLVIAAGITAYQAAQKTRLETGSFFGGTFGRNFKDQLMANARLVANTVKSKLGRQSTGTVTKEGKNSGDRADAEPAGDKAKAQESAEDAKKSGKKVEKKGEKKAKKKAKKKAPDKEDKGQA